MPFYESVDELDFQVAELPPLPLPSAVLLADPQAFEAREALNPHMLDDEGALHVVDRSLARTQWEGLRSALTDDGWEVEVVSADGELCDLVFCANPALPIPAAATSDGRPRVVPSRMAHPSRRGEVPHLVAALEQRGYAVEPLAGEGRLEGMGDGLWHRQRRLLWAGLGPRSTREAWIELAERYSLPIVGLELVDPDFYHLDTCVALLDETTCLWFPPALSSRSQALVRALIPNAIECSEQDARQRLACNAFCGDGHTVYLHVGSESTCAALSTAGFRVRELDTGEFLKSGGSVFCMKLALS